jgi:hypothetical protein
MLLVGFGNYCYSQTEITWEDLKFDTVVETWSEDFQSYYQVPHFTANTNKLDGKEISIKGYFHPIDLLDGYYELCKSEIITSYCYFPPRLETIEVQMNIESPPELNEQITISDILKLNTDDILLNNFILENAKIITDK